jgi:hypothetical protein
VLLHGGFHPSRESAAVARMRLAHALLQAGEIPEVFAGVQAGVEIAARSEVFERTRSMASEARRAVS